MRMTLTFIKMSRAWWAQPHSDARHCHSDACHWLGTGTFAIALQPNMMTHNKTESETHNKTRIRYAYIYPHKNTTDLHGQLLVDGGRGDVYHHLLWLQHRQASWLEGACVYVCVCGRRKCVCMCVWQEGVCVCNVRVWMCVCVCNVCAFVCVSGRCARVRAWAGLCVCVCPGGRDRDQLPPLIHTHATHGWCKDVGEERMYLVQSCKEHMCLQMCTHVSTHVSTDMHTCVYIQSCQMKNIYTHVYIYGHFQRKCVDHSRCLLVQWNKEHIICVWIYAHMYKYTHMYI